MQLYGRTEETPRHRLAGHKITATGQVSLIALTYKTHTYTYACMHTVHRLYSNSLQPNVNLLFTDQY